MTRPTRLALLILIAVQAFLPSCCCSEPVDTCPKKAPTNDCLFYLTCVEFDRCNLDNVGALPIYRQSDGYSFGATPVAFGTMQAARSGLWSINVKFRESVIALSGRSGAHEYDVLTLAGKASKDGKRIISQNASANSAGTGAVTEVRVHKISDTKLKVQPATCDRLLPYIFTFDRKEVQARPISVPLL